MSNLARGMVVLALGIFLGVVMSWIGGSLLDGIYANNYHGVQLIPYSAQAASTLYFQQTTDASHSIMLYYINLYYAFCFFLPLIGTWIFFNSIFEDAASEAYSVSPSNFRRRA
jgi:hypothetical protein